MAEQQPPEPPDQPLPPPVAADKGAPTEAPADLKKTKNVHMILVRIGAAVLFIAGALVLISSFLPWVTGGQQSFSGWKLMQLNTKLGGNPLVTSHFSYKGSIFFFGLCTFIVGLLLMALAIIYLFKLPKGIGRVLDGAVILSVFFVGLLVVANWLALEGPIMTNTPAGKGVGLTLLIVSAVVAIGGFATILLGREFG